MKIVKTFLLILSVFAVTSVMAQIYTIQPVDENGIDTYVSSQNDSTNYGDYQFMYFGGCSWPQKDTFNMYIKFDLDSVLPVTTVTSARLDFVVYGQNGGMTNYNSGVYKVLEPWQEDSLYWYNQPVCDSMPIDTVFGSNIQSNLLFSWRTLTIPDSLVQEWIDDSLSNNGIIIKQINGFYGYPYIITSDWASFPQYFPRLVINSPGTRISGIITDSVSGDPLQGVVIGAYMDNGSKQFALDTTDADGNYLLNVLFPNAYQIKVPGITGYMSKTIDSLYVSEGENYSLNILMLPDSHAVAGVVSGVWTKAESPYIISDDIYVLDSTQLVIEPDVTVMYAGSYRMYVYGCLKAVGTPADSIIFTCYDTTKYAKGMGLKFEYADSCILAYCKIENGYAFDKVWGQSDLDRGGAINSYDSDLIVDNCKLSNNFATHGGAIYALNDEYDKKTIFRRNMICDNIAYSYGCSSDGGGGVVLYGSYDNKIFFENNIVTGNSFDLSYPGNSEGGGGVMLLYNHIYFVNNTITDNYSTRGSGIFCASFEGSIENNIIYGNKGSLTGDQVAIHLYNSGNEIPSEFSIHHNCIQDTAIIVEYNNTPYEKIFNKYSNISDYPVFTDTVNGNYRLLAGSPCIDAGLNDNLMSQFDYDMNCRIFDGDDDDTGTVDMGAVEYNAHEMVLLDLGNDTSSCSNNVLVLDAGTFAGYLWNTSETQQSITADSSSIYEVLVTDSLGCFAFDSVNATILPIPDIHLYGDTALCSESFDVDADAGYESYMWNDSISGGNSYPVTSTGDYFVFAVNSYGCGNYSDTMHVELYPIPSVTLNDTTIKFSSGYVVLDAGVGYADYLWSNDSTTQTVILTGANLGVGPHDVYVTVTNQYGCTDEAHAVITVVDDSGIDDNSLYGNISVYPVPAKDVVSLDFNLLTETSVKIFLVDNIGRELYSFELKDVLKQHHDIDVSKYSSGAYILIIESEKQALFRKAIYKQ